MIESKQMADVFKAATEVTSLSSTDRVLVADASGVQKRVSSEKLTKEIINISGISSPQWIRIASFKETASLLANVTAQYNGTAGLHIIFDMILHQNNVDFCKVCVLSRLVHLASNTIDKIRVVCKSGNTGYLDIHYGASAVNSVSIEAMSWKNLTLFSTPELNPAIPDGFNTKEFSLTSVSWGGVNHYLSTHYAILQKGGLRNDRDETTDGRPHKKQSSGRDVIERQLYRFRYLPQSRNICSLSSYNCEFSSWCGPIRYRESGSISNLRPTDIFRTHRFAENVATLFHSDRSNKPVFQALGICYYDNSNLACGKEVAA